MKATGPNRKPIIREGALVPTNTGVCLIFQFVDLIANTLFSGLGIAMAKLATMLDESEGRTQLGISQLEWLTPKYVYLNVNVKK